MTSGAPQADPEQTAAAHRASWLRFLCDGGVLELPVNVAGARVIRLELQESVPQCLHLQTLGVETRDQISSAKLARSASISSSSRYPSYADKFAPAKFLDFEHAHGTQVHTEADDMPWIEIGLDTAIDITRLRIRNVSNGTWGRAVTLKVSVCADRRWQVVFDGLEVSRLLTEEILAAAEPIDPPSRSELQAVLSEAMAGRYAPAWKRFAALTLDATAAAGFKTAVNELLLSARRMEWTIHGPRRCFRYWSPAQKQHYAAFAAMLADELTDLTPNVCFGFGAALCVVRDGEFIPHDDDLDLLVAFEPDEADSLPMALHRVEDFLRPRDYTVTGAFSAHRQVSWRGKAVDVFVGLFEGDGVSWYPGARGVLTRQMMFPPSAGSIYGISVPLPRDPTSYLEKIYGPGWVSPDPDFQHSWDRKAYTDQQRAPKKSATS